MFVNMQPDIDEYTVQGVFKGILHVSVAECLNWNSKIDSLLVSLLKEHLDKTKITHLLF